MVSKLKCKSCGGLNTLPEGRSKMFCSFCGNPIEKEEIEKAADIASVLKSKPQVYRGELSLTGRGLKSLNEILCWFSDSELDKIGILNLSDNKIQSLEGLNKFNNLLNVNLSKNNIVGLTGLSNVRIMLGLTIDLSKNKIITISQSDVGEMSQIYLGSNSNLLLNLDLRGNPISNYDWIETIKLEEMFPSLPLEKKKKAKIEIETDDQIIIKRFVEGDEYEIKSQRAKTIIEKLELDKKEMQQAADSLMKERWKWDDNETKRGIISIVISILVFLFTIYQYILLGLVLIVLYNFGFFYYSRWHIKDLETKEKVLRAAIKENESKIYKLKYDPDFNR